MKTVVATPGKLGLSVAFPDEGGGAVIKKINPDCPFGDEVEVGDKIVTIDGKNIYDFDDLRAGNDKPRDLGVVPKSSEAEATSSDQEEEAETTETMREEVEEIILRPSKEKAIALDRKRIYNERFEKITAEAVNQGLELSDVRRPKGRRKLCRVLACDKIGQTKFVGFCCRHYNLASSALDDEDDDGSGGEGGKDDDDWECGCGQKIAGRQMRCGVCNKWKGGKRTLHWYSRHNGKGKGGTPRKRARRKKAVASEEAGEGDLAQQEKLDHPSIPSPFSVEKCTDLGRLEEHANYLNETLKATMEELELTQHRMEHLREYFKTRKICTMDGCNNIAKGGGGLCMRHQDKKPAWYYCKFEGCTRKSQKGGFCASHGGGTRPQCMVEGCSSVSQKGGVCRKHQNFSASETEL